MGEFGVEGNTYYPELFHNSIWAALGAGASMTPAEWNSGGAFGEMTPEMNADISRLAQFVQDLPLARWNPSAIQITSKDEKVRAWGQAGEDGGLIWIQDFSLEGKSIDDVRNSTTIQKGVQLSAALPAGSYTVMPYDTRQGIYLNSLDVNCEAGQACLIDVPDFQADIAFKIIRK